MSIIKEYKPKCTALLALIISREKFAGSGGMRVKARKNMRITTNPKTVTPQAL